MDNVDKSHRPNSQIVIYRTEDGQIKLEVRLENETVWLTQKMMEFTKGQDFQPICLKGGIKAILDDNIENFYNNLKKEKLI
jgi:hypothetical protein